MSLLGVGPEKNKFEQVSSDHHQISVVGGMSPVMTIRCHWQGGGVVCDLSHDACDVSTPLP